MIRKPSSRHTFHIIAHFFGFVNTFFHFFQEITGFFRAFGRKKRRFSEKSERAGHPAAKPPALFRGRGSDRVHKGADAVDLMLRISPPVHAPDA
ncbi:MAG: hypothetical protein IIV17_04025, partial [Clostridia bacterium]|nr:hypothetical protein [Clostridia bacterium]